MKQWIVPAIVSFLLGLLASAMAGAVLVLPALSRIEAAQDAQSVRIANLESGQTTPISAQARDAIEELRRGLAATNTRLDALALSLAKLRKDDSRAIVKPMVPKGG